MWAVQIQLEKGYKIIAGQAQGIIQLHLHLGSLGNSLVKQMQHIPSTLGLLKLIFQSLLYPFDFYQSFNPGSYKSLGKRAGSLCSLPGFPISTRIVHPKRNRTNSKCHRTSLSTCMFDLAEQNPAVACKPTKKHTFAINCADACGIVEHEQTKPQEPSWIIYRF